MTVSVFVLDGRRIDVTGAGYSPVGLFTDVGFRYHRVYANNNIALVGEVDASLSWAQLSVNAGIQLAF